MAEHAGNGAGNPIDARLEELRRQQEESDRKAKREEQRAKDYKADLDALTKAKDGLDNALAEYRAKLGELEDQRKELWRYRDQRYKANRGAVGEDAGRLADSFGKYNKELEDSEEELDSTRKERLRRRSALENAEWQVEKARGDFDALTQHAKTIADRFATLEALKTRLDQADDEALHALKYVLILEFDLVLRNAGRDPGEPCHYWKPGDADEPPTFYSPAAYKGRLVHAAQQLNRKQEELREAQETDADLTEKVQSLETDLAARRATRVDHVAQAGGADDGTEEEQAYGAASAREERTTEASTM